MARAPNATELLRRRLEPLVSARYPSINQAALAFGMTRSHLHAVLRGKRSLSQETLARVCAALGLSLAEFWAGAGPDAKGDRS